MNKSQWKSLKQIFMLRTHQEGIRNPAFKETGMMFLQNQLEIDYGIPQLWSSLTLELSWCKFPQLVHSIQMNLIIAFREKEIYL